MGHSSAEILQSTLEGLEAGLHVQHIATFDLSTCNDSQEAQEVLDEPDLRGFSQIPVTEGERIVGVLERKSDLSSGLVKDRMRPIDEISFLRTPVCIGPRSVDNAQRRHDREPNNGIHTDLLVKERIFSEYRFKSKSAIRLWGKPDDAWCQESTRSVVQVRSRRVP